MQPIRLVVANENCKPHVGSAEAAGMDLRMNVKTATGFTPFLPNQVLKFGTGVKIEIPKGWVGLVMPRSGLGTKYEVTLLNTVGVIDSDYRGEIQVAIRNRGDKEVMLEDYERVCQMVLVPHYLVFNNLEYVDSLSETERGENGHGSSGKL
ncbi:dUTPase [Vibrio phage phi 3]|uniref:dUTP diphosphatase n=1 Tax=Vibrio phage phi 3 TaxID=1589298 RepID=A0A0B5HAU8_9CAUD|nr:dUTPase [Vibrio phage phi 3]AJF40889.1 putative deoxyUTP pyrophosphatase [Vibrio phage phi 3]